MAVSGELALRPATQGLLGALRAACDSLHAAPEGLESISVVGRLLPGSTALPLLARAETLAREFEFTVLARLEKDNYEIRFSRTAHANLA